MPKEFSRGHRIGDLIQRELAVLLQQEIKDPRVGMVTINEVKVSRDLAFADVYFTMLPEGNSDGGTEVLNNAAGFLRSQLAKVMSTRTTPRLRFHYDESIENGARMSKVINDALKRDAANHQPDRPEQESEGQPVQPDPKENNDG
jgi:ribosome-binding factor A